MHQQDQERLIGDTLALVNVVREAFGVSALSELPDASPGHASDCLFARALRPVGVTSVGGEGRLTFDNTRAASRVAALWGTAWEGHHVRAPGQFEEVIAAFDAGELTQYADKPRT